jgi:hypothetical protein
MPDFVDPSLQGMLINRPPNTALIDRSNAMQFQMAESQKQELDARTYRYGVNLAKAAQTAETPEARERVLHEIEADPTKKFALQKAGFSTDVLRAGSSSDMERADQLYNKTFLELSTKKRVIDDIEKLDPENQIVEDSGEYVRIRKMTDSELKEKRKANKRQAVIDEVKLEKAKFGLEAPIRQQKREEDYQYWKEKQDVSQENMLERLRTKTGLDIKGAGDAGLKYDTLSPDWIAGSGQINRILDEGGLSVNEINNLLTGNDNPISKNGAKYQRDLIYNYVKKDVSGFNADEQARYIQLLSMINSADEVRPEDLRPGGKHQRMMELYTFLKQNPRKVEAGRTDLDSPFALKARIALAAKLKDKRWKSTGTLLEEAGL